jgi:hypothetical protein
MQNEFGIRNAEFGIARRRSVDSEMNLRVFQRKGASDMTTNMMIDMIINTTPDIELQKMTLILLKQK